MQGRSRAHIREGLDDACPSLSSTAAAFLVCDACFSGYHQPGGFLNELLFRRSLAHDSAILRPRRPESRKEVGIAVAAEFKLGRCGNLIADIRDRTDDGGMLPVG